MREKEKRDCVQKRWEHIRPGHHPPTKGHETPDKAAKYPSGGGVENMRVGKTRYDPKKGLGGEKSRAGGK